MLGRNMSQKLSVLLIIMGLAWGLMLLLYTGQQPHHQSSGELHQQILELSRRYVKVLTEENQNAPGGPQGTSMAGYGKGCFRAREKSRSHHLLFCCGAGNEETLIYYLNKTTYHILLEPNKLFYILIIFLSHTQLI